MQLGCGAGAVPLLSELSVREAPGDRWKQDEQAVRVLQADCACGPVGSGIKLRSTETRSAMGGTSELCDR
jgi:hypothetical protein